MRRQVVETQGLDRIGSELIERGEIGEGGLAQVELDRSPGRESHHASGFADPSPKIGSGRACPSILDVKDSERTVVRESDCSDFGLASSGGGSVAVRDVCRSPRAKTPAPTVASGTDDQEDHRGGPELRMDHGPERRVGPCVDASRGRPGGEAIDREVSQ